MRCCSQVEGGISRHCVGSPQMQKLLYAIGGNDSPNQVSACSQLRRCHTTSRQLPCHLCASSDRRARLCRTRRRKYSTVMFFTLTCIQVGRMAAPGLPSPGVVPARDRSSICRDQRPGADEVTDTFAITTRAGGVSRVVCPVLQVLSTLAFIISNSYVLGGKCRWFQGGLRPSCCSAYCPLRSSGRCRCSGHAHAPAPPRHPELMPCRCGHLVWRVSVGYWMVPAPIPLFPLISPIPMILRLVSESTRAYKSASPPQSPSVARQQGLQPSPCRRLMLPSAL